MKNFTDIVDITFSFVEADIIISLSCFTNKKANIDVNISSYSHTFLESTCSKIKLYLRI